MCLAQGHKAVMPVRLEPTARCFRDKRSTTEPLCSHEHLLDDGIFCPWSRVATVREKNVEMKFFSRSGKSGEISFSVREI